MKPCSFIIRTLIASLLGLGAVGIQAEDIDIYTAAPANADMPNVLILLDSSANWSTRISGASDCFYKENGVVTTTGPVAGDQGTKFAVEQCALYNLVDALPVASSGGADNDALFRIAITMPNESPNNGTYPRIRFLPLTSNNKAWFKAKIKAYAIGGDKGSNADFGLGMYEAYLYYKGMAPLNGTLTSAKWDSASVANGNYVSPAGGSCGRNYVIVIGNGSPQNSNPEKSVEGLMAARIDADLASLPAAARTALKAKIVNAFLGNDAANWSDEMARFMYRDDFSGKDGTQSVITHAIAVLKGSSDGDFPALMNSIANNGGGSYFSATNADVLLKSLLDIFNQIQAVNSVFASASLPVAVNARGTFLNQVYMGMFRPDADAKPRWRGNLKQYKFALDGVGELSLVDSSVEAISAVNSSTGFINPAAVSFWSKSSNFWINQASGTPASTSDSPDGEVVEKGGAAQRLRESYASSQSGRKVTTCIGCAGGTTLGAATATRFEDGNSAVTKEMLGLSTATERTALINWMRGADNRGDEQGPGGSVTVRPTVHGDVLHSRPVVLNYAGNTGVVVFYGANDGMVHAINGNQTGTGAGEELWSFVPEEMLGRLSRIYSNAPEIRMPNTPAGGTARSRDYFVDGPIGFYQKIESGATSKAIIYVSMRRGGRMLYAIDVTTPTAPKYLWRKTDSDLSRLGQTWSEPKVARIKGNTNPVLIFGAGYDATAEDTATPGSTTMGHAVYVLDAFTGALIKAFTPMTRSVAADVSLVDSDFDGLVDRLYAVDLGGQVWRMDLEDNAGVGDTANWGAYKLANLSGGTNSGRKFFFGPDVVVTKNFVSLQFGSGDREKPLLSSNTDHFFAIYDWRPQKGTSTTHVATLFGDLQPVGGNSTVEGLGCYIALATGEKTVNAGTTFAGKTYFGTHRPTPSSGNSCSANLGEAKGYAFPLFCATSSSWVFNGGGLPPSPIAGIVRVEVGGVSKEVGFVTGASPSSPLAPIRPVPVIDSTRTRSYWFPEVRR